MTIITIIVTLIAIFEFVVIKLAADTIVDFLIETHNQKEFFDWWKKEIDSLKNYLKGH